MAAERIFPGYNAVDNAYFVERVEGFRNNGSHTGNGIETPGKFFLASARFVGKKNLPRLLQAYARYRQLAEKSAIGNRQSAIWHLVLLGDGPLRSSIFDLRSSLGLEASVHLPGFTQYDELPAYYARAGAFVHASATEQWGLVVNEAMASGLPVLVSNRCGCAAELVQAGKNGFTFDPGNIEELAGLMVKISSDSFPRSDFGRISREIVANWGCDRFAEGVDKAVNGALAAGPRRISSFDRVLLRSLAILKQSP
jgi:glycosyltransferase involved in cell wall biosynthesis